MEEIGIDTPMGLPEDPRKAFELGEMFGLKRMILLCETNVSGDFVDVVNMIRIKNKVKSYKFDKNTLLFVEESLPSDAFQLGVYQGIIRGHNICLPGIGNFAFRKALLIQMEDSFLYKKYASPKNVSKPRKVGFLKSYFGLDTGRK